MFVETNKVEADERRAVVSQTSGPVPWTAKTSTYTRRKHGFHKGKSFTVFDKASERCARCD